MQLNFFAKLTIMEPYKLIIQVMLTVGLKCNVIIFKLLVFCIWSTASDLDGIAGTALLSLVTILSVFVLGMFILFVSSWLPDGLNILAHKRLSM